MFMMTKDYIIFCGKLMMLSLNHCIIYWKLDHDSNTDCCIFANSNILPNQYTFPVVDLHYISEVINSSCPYIMYIFVEYFPAPSWEVLAEYCRVKMVPKSHRSGECCVVLQDLIYYNCWKIRFLCMVKFIADASVI